MLFDGRRDRPWKSDQERKNELVFIGRNLNETQLRNNFRACLQPRNQPEDSVHGFICPPQSTQCNGSDIACAGTSATK
jgi:hypothetical protein